jgi:glycosyltransferase involved in cell wall biosynthesis
MKILLNDWTWGIHGGPEEFLIGIKNELVSRNFDVRVVQEGTWKRLFLETRKNLNWADIICSFAFPSSLMVGLTKKPCVWICYDVPEAFYKWYKVPAFWWNKKVWKKRNRYIVCSNITDTYSLEVIYRRKVNYIYPLTIDCEFFHYYPRSSNGFGICQVGTILRNKNQLETIDIFNLFQKDVPNSTLTLAGPRILTGSGPVYWNSCLERIRRYKLEEKVIMPGHLSRENVRNLYSSSNVYINNLRGTGGWLAVLEALSTGLPVVSNKWFFGWEYLYPFCWVGDNVLEGLKEVNKNYSLYLEKAKEGSSWIKENLNHKVYVDKLLEVFYKALDEYGSDGIT